MDIGPWEIGLILIVVLLIFGTGKLANVGRDLGRAIRGFKEESRGPSEEAKEIKPATINTVTIETADDEQVQDDPQPAVKAVAKKKIVSKNVTA